MKLKLIYVSSLVVLLLFCASPSLAQSFSDVPSDHWYTEAVNNMAQSGYMAGYPTGDFRPKRKISRAEFTAILYKMAQSPEVGESAYDDVKANQWFYAPIAWAKENQVSADFVQNQFEPQKAITRQEAAVMLANYLRQTKPHLLKDEASHQRFSDQWHIAPWAQEAVRVMGDSAILAGYSDGSFKPDLPITRAETAAILHKAQQKEADKNSATKHNKYSAKAYPPFLQKNIEAFGSPNIEKNDNSIVYRFTNGYQVVDYGKGVYDFRQVPQNMPLLDFKEPLEVDQAQQKMVDAINHLRHSQGLAPLKMVAKLNQQAKWRAKEEMEELYQIKAQNATAYYQLQFDTNGKENNGYPVRYPHNRPDMRRAETVFSDWGYDISPYFFYENLSTSVQTNPRMHPDMDFTRVFNGLVSSPGHYRVMVHPQVKYIRLHHYEQDGAIIWAYTFVGEW